MKKVYHYYADAELHGPFDSEQANASELASSKLTSWMLEKIWNTYSLSFNPAKAVIDRCVIYDLFSLLKVKGFFDFDFRNDFDSLEILGLAWIDFGHCVVTIHCRRSLLVANEFAYAT